MSAIPASWLSGLPIRSFRFRAAGRVVILLLTALAAPAAAQQSLERVVGEDENGTPIVVTTVEALTHDVVLKYDEGVYLVYDTT